MKHLTVESFVNNLPEEEIWKIIEDWERWKYDSPLVRKKAREFSNEIDFTTAIVMSSYRYFTLKYKESIK